jgi:hypothetical protein
MISKKYSVTEILESREAQVFVLREALKETKRRFI